MAGQQYQQNSARYHSRQPCNRVTLMPPKFVPALPLRPSSSLLSFYRTGIDTNLNEQGGGLGERSKPSVSPCARAAHILLERSYSTLDPKQERQLIKNSRRLHRQNIHLHHTPSGSSRGLRSNYNFKHPSCIHLAFIIYTPHVKDDIFCSERWHLLHHPS